MKKDKLSLSPVTIGIAVLLFLLLIGFSCNVHIEIKQKPSDAQTKE